MILKLPHRRLSAYLILLISLLFSSCNLPGVSINSPTATSQMMPAAIPTTTPEAAQAIEVEATPTQAVYVPVLNPPTAESPAAAQPTALPPSPEAAAPTGGPVLAYLFEGNLWVLDAPQAEPRPLTRSAGARTFVWAPDGTRLAFYTGRLLCFTALADGEITGCIDLGLNDYQASIDRQLAWSPDQRYLVLWNATNPWDEGALGWVIINLDSPQQTWVIEDPVDWGASLSPNNDPGGITGQPIFLPDGSLLGALSHRWLCSAGGCHYYLYQFNFATGSFQPYPNKPEEGWSEGQRLLLSTSGRLLLNFASFGESCQDTVSFVDLFDLGSTGRQAFSLSGERLLGAALDPSASQLILARQNICSPSTNSWASSCGLAEGLDLLPMQSWNLASGERRDFLPGLEPTWSPDGAWVAFRSCLTAGEQGGLVPSGTIAPAIYLWNLASGAVVQVGPGEAPAWKP